MTALKYLLYAEQNYAYAMLRPLQEAIHKRGGEAKWFLAGSTINPQYLHNHEHRLLDVDAVVQWRPDVVISPGNMVPSFIPGLKVDIFHGFNVAKATRSDDRGHFNIRGCYDLYCTQGPDTTQGFEERAEKHGFFRVRETGWPTLDPLFTSEPDTASQATPTLLLCSTFTPSLSCAPHLVETIRHLRDTKEWQWIVQFHPRMDENISAQYKALQNDKLTFVETDNVIPLLKKADLMVCDTSSVMLMFMLQNKPIVTFRNRTIGDTSYLLNVEETEQLAPAIETALSRPADLMQRIKKAGDLIHPYRDGRSSERVLEAIDDCLELGSNGLKKKPLNLLRNLKERKKLGYWRC
ncbi:MAG TPA: CDP-glycerol glycerophosphotransferase family protein [Alcanivoracaceae bacterium]|nr:CDP-glycerol glycerophosphotransferase family protein [Alcanivoracaceae bacterium]